MPRRGWRCRCRKRGGHTVSLDFERPAASSEPSGDSAERLRVGDTGRGAVEHEIEVRKREGETAARVSSDVPSLPGLGAAYEIEGVVRPKTDDAC